MPALDVLLRAEVQSMPRGELMRAFICSAAHRRLWLGRPIVWSVRSDRANVRESASPSPDGHPKPRGRPVALNAHTPRGVVPPE